MIYTITINPSIDYVVDVEHFVPGLVNRTAGENLYPGGKGINVSVVLSNLGFKTTAWGFTAGFTGEKITALLKEKNIQTDFIKLSKGNSRINVKLRSGKETEINGHGPQISEKALSLLYQKLKTLHIGDVLVLAGSVPSSLPDSLYADIMSSLKGKNIKIVVDATQGLLKQVLAYHPFLVKPNNHELGELFGVTISSKDKIIEYARRIHDMGAENVLVSMAEEGAILVTDEGKILEGKVQKCIPVNSVGSGDSMVAGFIAGYMKNCSYQEALLLGLSCGTASVCTEWLPSKKQIEAVYSKIKICPD